MVATINNALLHVLSAAGSFRARLAEERGQDLIEYAMLSGLIAMAIALVGVLAYQGGLTAMANGIKDCIDFDSTTGCHDFG